MTQPEMTGAGDDSARLDRLEELARHLNHLQASAPSAPATPVLASSPPAREPKAAPIDKFNGHPEKVKPFLADLRTRFMLQPHTHANDAVKVLTAISHLEGSAKAWAAPILEGYRDELVENYTLFTQELQEQFGDPNLHDTLAEKLRHLRQTTSVLAYANDFENLAYQIQWPKVVWGDTFYHGLKDQVKDMLIYSPVSRTDYDGLKCQAISIDQRIQNRERESKVVNKKAAVTTTTTTYATTATGSDATNLTTPRQTTPGPRGPRGPLSQAEKDRRRAAGLCLYCGEAGHIAALCTNKKGPTFAATGTDETGKVQAQAE